MRTRQVFAQTVTYTSGGSVTVDGVDNTSYTLDNLEKDTLYTITVQATTDDNDKIGSYSIAVTVTIFTDG